MSGYVVRHDRRIEVERLNTDIKPRPRAEPFVQVPLSWAVKVAKVCVLENQSHSPSQTSGSTV
jgi:hypothetical protein